VSDVEEAITRAHHDELARMVAALTRRFGNDAALLRDLN